jgi:hypothetical protein
VEADGLLSKLTTTRIDRPHLMRTAQRAANTLLLRTATAFPKPGAQVRFLPGASHDFLPLLIGTTRSP